MFLFLSGTGHGARRTAHARPSVQPLCEADGRAYRTGDLASWSAEKGFELHGRRDHQAFSFFEEKGQRSIQHGKQESLWTRSVPSFLQLKKHVEPVGLQVARGNEVAL